MRMLAVGAATVGALAILLAQEFGPDLSESMAGTTFALAGGPTEVANALKTGRVAHPTGTEIPDEALTAAVRRTCVACHNDQLQTGNLSLQNFSVEGAVDHAAISEKMIVKLRLEMMPPPGIPRPGGDTLQALVETLEAKIDQAAALDPNPGSRRFQRLSRAEYARVIRDLLGLQVDPSRWLPQDLGRFDSEAAAQGLSTTAAQAYLQAAEDVSRFAVGNPGASATSRTYQAPADRSQHAWEQLDGAPWGTRGGIVVVHDFPVDGEYVFSVETILGRGTGFSDVDLAIDGERVALLGMELGRPSGVPRTTEPVYVRAGQRTVSAAFVREMDGPYDDRFSPHGFSNVAGEDEQGWANYGLTALPHLQALRISGPFSSEGIAEIPAGEKVFTCWPSAPEEERACAESIIGRLAVEAYRRPVADDEIAALMSFYDHGAATGDFRLGVRAGIQAILSSSSFVFRLEQEPADVRAGENFFVDDVDLASRLSFFLWASVPDEELLSVAREGRLSELSVLEAQVRRMLADPRSEALATRFAAQWFRLQNLAGIKADAFLFPDYSIQVAEAMRRETELLFDHLIREDRSFLELFTADYTFLNGRLAEHYGMPHPGGHEFRRVDNVDPNRRGLLGHGSILTLTSMGNRTSPVLRGEWVMTTLLGSPPPAPPPGVPVLDATGSSADGQFLTTRERMEIHRSNPTCNSCHQFIDPIGLSLDNFDPVGRWRIRENNRPLDTQGTYYDGTPIASPLDLVEALLQRPEPLVRTFTSNLMAYAIGRQVEYFDQPAIRAIARDAEANDYRMSSFILGVVKSEPFRMKRAEAMAAGM